MKIALLILAAGSSTRFNGCKLLAQYRSQTIIETSINSALSVCPKDTYVITGYWSDEILMHFQTQTASTVNWLHNPEWQKGMGKTIAEGVKSLQNSYDAILITAADQVALEPEDFLKLISNASSENAVCAFYGQSPGIPALFPKVFYPELLKLDSDKGAKKILINPENNIINVNMPNAQFDIDTIDDLRLTPKSNT